MKNRGHFKGTLYVRHLPKGVKDLFRATCVRRNESMQAVIGALMKLYIDNPRCITVRDGKRPPFPLPWTKEEREAVDGKPDLT